MFQCFDAGAPRMTALPTTGEDVPDIPRVHICTHNSSSLVVNPHGRHPPPIHPRRTFFEFLRLACISVLTHPTSNNLLPFPGQTSTPVTLRGVFFALRLGK